MKGRYITSAVIPLKPQDFDTQVKSRVEGDGLTILAVHFKIQEAKDVTDKSKLVTPTGLIHRAS